MRIRFTKMQGAGNDFVVLDETRGRLDLRPDQYRWLADRHFGVGADQVLTVRPSPAAGIDFEYVIHNADGGEVEQCGNGARCFVKFVHARGLTDKKRLRVETLGGMIEPRLEPDGEVSVDMGKPSRPVIERLNVNGRAIEVSIVSIGNPHAVQVVPDVASAPVTAQGPSIETHPRFPDRVNAGYMQVLDRHDIALRVWERGAGETLACGTGACAAVVAGISRNLLDSPVTVQTRGGTLTIAWPGGDNAVVMKGPAVMVFEGTLELEE